MSDTTLPFSTMPDNGETAPVPAGQITVRVVFLSGTPEAPLPEDPDALFVRLDKPVTPGTHAAFRALTLPILDYLEQVYGGVVNGIGAVEGINFDERYSGGYASLRYRTRLNFHYEQVLASSPAEWAVVDVAAAVDYDGPAAHDHRLWFGSTDYRKAVENAPRVRSRRMPVVINGAARGLIEVVADGTINALWHARNIDGEIARSRSPTG